MSDSARDTRRTHLLTADLRQTVLGLALPVFLEQFLSFCVGFYDTFLSGRISSDATTAIGLSAYVGWLASMMFGLVATGTTALVARHWGSGDYDEAGRVTNQSIALGGLLGLVFFAFICTAAPGFARLLDMQGETFRVSVRYLRIDGFGHIFTSVSLIGAAALRGSGDMRSPMLILGLVNVLNVAVSTVLVFGIGPLPAVGLHSVWLPSLGVDGIVLGTVVARVAGGVIVVVALSRGLGGLRLTRRGMGLERTTVWRILRIGGPAALDGAVTWTGHFLFLMIIARLQGNRLDSPLFAAHVIGIRVEAITYLPAVAWGMAAATLVGQSLGGGDPDRAARAGHEATRQCCCLAVLITGAFYWGADAIYAVMHDDPAVRSVGVPAFRLLAFFQVPLVISITYVWALRGAGETRAPLVITILGVFGVRLTMAYYFGIHRGGGLYGAWIGMCADVALRALLSWGWYVRGRWREKRI